MGVIRGHSPTEGAGSLTATRLEAIAGLPDDVARMFLSALQMPVLSEWPRVPAPSYDGAGLAARAGQVVVGQLLREPPAFVAREILDRLTEAAGRGRVAVVCALTCMRGVGKTQVAAAYARARVYLGLGTGRVGERGNTRHAVGWPGTGRGEGGGRRPGGRLAGVRRGGYGNICRRGPVRA